MTEDRFVQRVSRGDFAREGSARTGRGGRGRGVGARGLVDAEFGTEGKDFVEVEGEEVAAVSLGRGGRGSVSARGRVGGSTIAGEEKSRLRLTISASHLKHSLSNALILSNLKSNPSHPLSHSSSSTANHCLPTISTNPLNLLCNSTIASPLCCILLLIPSMT